MVSGRLRTVSFPDEQMIELGEEMISWLKAHPETLHLSEWYTCEKMFTYNQWKTFLQREIFIPYYEHALKIVGKKYLDGTVNSSIAQRWQRVYFKDVRDEEDAEHQNKLDRELEQKKSLADHESKLRSKEIVEVSEDQQKRHDALIEQLTRIQESSLNIAESNNNSAQ